MKIKTSELTGAALDWAVAKCEGKVEQGVYGTPQLWNTGQHLHYCDVFLGSSYSPSEDWAQGGPIIEREGIGFFCNRTASIGARFKPDAGADWRAFALNKHGNHFFGPTPLIAAMRCYVVSKLGDKIDIPEGLK